MQYFSDGSKIIAFFKNGRPFKNIVIFGPASDLAFCKKISGLSFEGCIEGKAKDIAPSLKSQFINLSEDIRSKIQNNLKELGIYTDTVDGKWGKETFFAITAYNAVNSSNLDFSSESQIDKTINSILSESPTKRFVSCFENTDYCTDVEILCSYASYFDKKTSDYDNSVWQKHAIKVETQASDCQNIFQETPIIFAKQNEIDEINLSELFNNGNFSDLVAISREKAHSGDGEAQYYLGYLYHLGAAVLQNNIKAHMWLNIANLNGHLEAFTLRNSVSSDMTKEAIEEAQQMAEICIKSDYLDCGEIRKENKDEIIALKEPTSLISFSPQVIESGFKELSRNEKRKLQFALKELGLYQDKIDGIWGMNTLKSIEKFNKISSKENYKSFDDIFSSVVSLVEIPKNIPEEVEQKNASKTKTNGTTDVTQQMLQMQLRAAEAQREAARAIAEQQALDRLMEFGQRLANPYGNTRQNTFCNNLWTPSGWTTNCY